MKICVKCGGRFSGEEISEWRAEHEPFSKNPFMCPDCYDTFSRQDLEDQFLEIMQPRRKATPLERTRAQVYATGNRWAIENFNATHN